MQVEWILVGVISLTRFRRCSEERRVAAPCRDTSEGVAQGQVDEIVVRVFAEDGVLPACPEHDARGCLPMIIEFVFEEYFGKRALPAGVEFAPDPRFERVPEPFAADS
mgnify:CR=1 FL=1